MPDIVFSISMSPDMYLRYYRGSAKHVVVRAEDGRRVQFPASALQAFIQKDGIHGRFRLLYDSNNKFQQLERVSS